MSRGRGYGRRLGAMCAAALALAALAGGATPGGPAAAGRPSTASVAVVRSDAAAVEVAFALGAYELEPGLSGRRDVRVRAPGLEAGPAPGGFDLPVRGVLLGIPPGGVPVLRVAADAGRCLPEPVPWALGRTASVEDAAAVLTDVGWVRGQRVARLEFRPFRYRAEDGRLCVHARIRATVRVPGAAVPRRAALSTEPALDAVLANAASAAAWRAERGPAPSDVPMSPREAPPDDRPRWNVEVEAEGLYRVTGADLLSSGVPIDAVDAAALRAFHGGREVALRVVGGHDGRLDAGDGVLFHASGPASKYDARSVVQLSVGPAPGRRMAERPARPEGGPALGVVTATIRLESNRLYAGDKPSLARGRQDPPGVDRWYGAVLAAPGSLASTVALPEPAASEVDVEVRVRAVGRSSVPSVAPDHRLVVSVDGRHAGEATWDGDVRRETLAFRATGVSAGGEEATVRLVAPGSPGAAHDQFYVDALEVDYPRRLRAADGRLAFQLPAGSADVLVGGLPSDQIEVYDVTDASAPVRLTGLDASRESGGFWRVRFRHDGRGAEGARYEVLTPEGERRPTAIVARPAPGLRDGGADLIVIAPASLLPAAARLGAHRAEGGARVAVVEAARAYDAFGGGVADPAAIRAFLAHAYASWAVPPPSSVLLVGDATHDPRRYLSDSRPTQLPTFLLAVDPWAGEAATDHPFATVSGDDPLPDLHVGRLPVNDAASASAAVDKILAYERRGAPEAWQRRMLFVADDPDAAGDFPDLSEAVRREVVPEAYSVDTVYLGRTHGDPRSARDAITVALGAGQVVVQYVGHGSVGTWAAEDLLRTEDLAALANGDRLPLLLDMTCLTGAFTDPVTDGLSETAVTMPASGAVAAFSPTGWGIATGHDHLGRAFLDALLGAVAPRPGPAATTAKLRLFAETTVGRDLLDTFVLLGDPELDVAIPEDLRPTPTPSPTPTSPPPPTATDRPSTGPGTAFLPKLARGAGFVR